MEFEMNAQAILNFYMQDLRFHFSFTDIEVRKVRVKHDHIGLSDDSFGNTLEKVLTQHAEGINQ